MKQQRMINRVVIILLVALLLIQNGSSAESVWAIATVPAEMTDLTNLDQLKEVFQRDRGAVRLVALLSPI